MTDLTTIDNRNVLVDDGWGDAAADASNRKLRGLAIKYNSNDNAWRIGKEHTPIEKGRGFYAIAADAEWVRMENKKVAERRGRDAKGRIPDRETLGFEDESRWETFGGQKQDPWKNTRYVHLLDPQTAEQFTFLTDTVGGRICWEALARQIDAVRRAHSGAVPVVELSNMLMPTDYGPRPRPHFRVVGWKRIADQPAAFSSAKLIVDDDIPCNDHVPPSGDLGPEWEKIDDEIPF
jgi:hypothetical protein